MSNLGGYQLVTTLMKRMGGPKMALAISGTAVSTAAIAVWESGKWCIRKAKYHFEKTNNALETYQVMQAGTYHDLTVEPGDVFVVLEQDDDTVLIEVKGKKGNPYMVSAQFLSTVADFS